MRGSSLGATALDRRSGTRTQLRLAGLLPRWSRVAAASAIVLAATACGSSNDSTSTVDGGTLGDDATTEPGDGGGDAAAVDADLLDSGAMDSGATDAAPSEAGAGDADASDGSAVASGGVYVGLAVAKVTDFTVDGAGDVVAQAAGSPFATGLGVADSILENAARTRVYVGGIDANTSKAYVASLTLDAAGIVSGAQSGSPFATGVTASPTRMALNPSGTRLYVAHQGVGGNSIAVFAIDASGNVGGLRPGSPFSTGTGTYGVTVNPAGTRLYVTSQEARAVFVFALDANGDVTGQRPGSPFKTGISDYPLIAAVHPSGAKLYVADQLNDVLVFTLDANGDVTGQETGSPFALPGPSTSVAVNAAGTRLYVAQASSVSAFPLDKTTGAITGAAVSYSPGITQASDLAVSTAGTRLYVVDSPGSRMAVVLLNAAGDPVGTESGSPFAAGMSPTSITTR